MGFTNNRIYLCLSLLLSVCIAFRRCAFYNPRASAAISLHSFRSKANKDGDFEPDSMKPKRVNFFDKLKQKRASKSIENVTIESISSLGDGERLQLPKELWNKVQSKFKAKGHQVIQEASSYIKNDQIKRSLLFNNTLNPDYKSGFITILGNPNVGKSTLMNALLNQNLSIVNSKPQTTRHRILGILTTNDYQMILTDTPGMLLPRYQLQASMQQTIHKTLHHDDPEAIVIMTDIYCEPLADYSVYEKLYNTTKPLIVVINKLDLLLNSTERARVSKARRSERAESSIPSPAAEPSIKNTTRKSWEEIVSYWQYALPQAEIIGISAQTRYNLPVLIDHLLSHLPKGPRYYHEDMTSDRDERFFTTEIIRETILSMYKDEVPYSVEVMIDSFKDLTDRFSEIRARIVVNRSTQVGILIGKDGERLKALGTAAKKKIEEFLDRKVYLGLQVAVDTDWRDNPKSLEKYGYAPETKKKRK